MANEEFLQEAQELIQSVFDAETSNFLEIAKIAELNLKEDLVGADLSGFDLSNGDLSNADLSNANLVGVNLSNANLSNANLSNTNLSNANLTNANLKNAKLSNTNLSNTDLTNAKLVGANLLIANIPNAIFQGCEISHEYLVGAKMVLSYLSYGDTSASNLSNVKQLVTSASSGSPNDPKDAEVEKFKDFLIEEAHNLDTEESRTISQLLKEYLDKAENLNERELVFTYRYELEEIEQAYKACKEASTWLSDKRLELVESARNLILENKLNIEAHDGIAVPIEQVDRFCESVNIYLLWIEHHIAKGSVPTPLPQGFIALALRANYYVQVFEFIRDHKISTENGLSSAAVTELKGYFNRFIVKPLL